MLKAIVSLCRLTECPKSLKTPVWAKLKATITRTNVKATLESFLMAFVLLTLSFVAEEGTSRKHIIINISFETVFEDKDRYLVSFPHSRYSYK